MSLQKNLLDNIQKAYPKEASIDELFGICHLLNHKQSTGERKLRVLTHSGLIEPIKTDKGAIKAYRALNFTDKNTAEIVGNLKRKIDANYGKFLGLDKDLKPIYEKDLKQEPLFTPRQIIY